MISMTDNGAVILFFTRETDAFQRLLTRTIFTPRNALYHDNERGIYVNAVTVYGDDHNFKKEYA